MPASPTETSQPVTSASLAAGNASFPPLAGDELQLWRFPLPLPDSPLRRAVESLPNATEHARAGRLVFAADRLRQLHSRGLLRLLLGASLGHPPHSLRFIANPHGKPALADAPELHFNLSHCHDRALIGLTRAAPIGVDVERIRPLADRDALITHCFSPAEQAWLAGRPASSREPDFFRIWTAKEAVLKALGSGLATAPESLTIHLAENGNKCAGVDGVPGPWTLFTHSPEPAHVMATAVRALLAPGRIRQFHLTDDACPAWMDNGTSVQQDTFHGNP